MKSLREMWLSFPEKKPQAVSPPRGEIIMETKQPYETPDLELKERLSEITEGTASIISGSVSTEP